ncbi:Aldose 1-epimerase [Planctomycetes bacterium Pan216]|uniref:Aldose 1-epimerase n=1 Tax=Kolteria novifilia TaxID=2527975 RepID=A0A518AXN2_9BACT|nr:Aldose 1-epimerase [Planctomycetes bacterium Pan216]
MKFLSRLLVLGLFATPVSAGQINDWVNPDTGWVVYLCTQGDTSIALAPAAGCNVYSIKYQGVEMLRQPESLTELKKGPEYGTPILYPTPGKVRDAKFFYKGENYSFTPNEGPHFAHGVVFNAPFEVVNTSSDDESTTVTCALNFTPETPWGKSFPFAHKLIVEVSVTAKGVRWTYTVDNSNGQKSVPYGFGLHPWFVYHGSRANSYLTVPAANLMEADELLPSGRLLTLGGKYVDGEIEFGSKQPVGKPVSLGNFVADNLYYGLRPEQPIVVNFRDASKEIGLFGSTNFNHAFVYTPMKPYFSIVNSTSASDAHNLHAKGQEKTANLLVTEGGGKDTGWVELRMKYFGPTDQVITAPQ